MRKLFVTTCALTILSLLFFSPTALSQNMGDNILDNSSSYFENGYVGGWYAPSYNDNDGYASVALGTPGYDGSAGCMVLENTLEAVYFNAQAAYDFEYSLPRRKYQLSFYAKAGSDGLTLDFGYQKEPFLNGDMNGMVFALSTEWEYYTITFDSDFGDIARVFFNFAQNVGTIYIDNIIFKDMGDAAPEPEYLDEPEVSGNMLTGDSYHFNGGTVGYWQGLNNAEFYVGIAKHGSDGSEYCMRVINPISADFTDSQVAYYCSFQSGHTYRYSFKAKTDETAEIKTAITVYDSNNDYLYLNTCELTDEWQEFSGTIDVPSNGSNSFLFLIGKDVAKYYIDHIIITEVEPAENIQFADANVKAKCVANWDTNGDGELSYAEAAAVTDLGDVFAENWDGPDDALRIRSFDELQYFTGLTQVGNFQYCYFLESIKFPQTLRSFKYRSFWVCDCLDNVVIPKSVTYFPSEVFDGCRNMTSLRVEDGNLYYDSRDDCNAVIETSSNTLIAGCKNTTIPNTVTAIGQGAFSMCYDMESIQIPGSVESIGDVAFYDCYALPSIEIPNSVKSIGWLAFCQCYSLQSLRIPASVTSIGTPFMQSCYSVESLQVDADNLYYDSRDGCNAIIETSTNTLIAGCMNTVIPNTVTRIGEEAFWGCSGLTSIVIPNSVTSIGSDGLSYCNGLTAIDIPSSIVLLEQRALSSRYIVDVTVHWNYPLAITADVFSDMNLSAATLHVPYGTKFLYETAEVWRDFGTIIEDVEREIENIQFADADVKAICVANWDFNGDGELSKDEAAAVTSLNGAFRNQTALKYFCELQYFKGLTEISDNDFSGCTNLLALEWNKEGVTVPRGIMTQPNAILYVGPNVTSLYEGITVRDGVAGDVVLTDAMPLYIPRAFVASSIRYTRNFSMQTIPGVSAGWETIVLPFDVQSITHETQGSITPFNSWYYDYGKKFWLGTLGQGGGFVSALSISANVPYIISMPNSTMYNDEYNLNGNVTFAAYDAWVYPTTEAGQIQGASFNLLPAYEIVGSSTSVYAINQSQYDGYAAGSVFVRDSRSVEPFESYISPLQVASARPYFIIGDNGTTSIRYMETDIKPDSQTDLMYNIYGMPVDENYHGIVIMNGVKYLK